MAVAYRNHTLDGIRGCLAVVVMLNHALHLRGYGNLTWPANVCVSIFFMLSACVLTRSWDGQYFSFLLKRCLRLWPTYALCLFVGGVLHREAIPLHWYAWFPVARPEAVPLADVPIWSLTVEAWAMLFMPVFVWVGRRSAAWMIASLIVALVCARYVHWAMGFGMFFFAGAWLSRFSIRWAPLETMIPRWLGRISYPLYLCHFPIIWWLGLPIWASIALTFVVAAILTETVEKWSIRASRRVGRLTLKGESAKLGALQPS